MLIAVASPARNKLEKLAQVMKARRLRELALFLNINKEK